MTVEFGSIQSCIGYFEDIAKLYWVPVSAPKERESIAQSEALGSRDNGNPSPEGAGESAFSRPFGPWPFDASFSQGCALGYVLSLLRS